MTPSDRTRILDIARAEIGVREEPSGSNDGPRVRQYQIAVSIDPAWPASQKPWCAAFVYWVFRKALSDANPLPRTPSTPRLYRWAADNERFIDADESKPGDLVLFYSSSLHRIAHVGIVSVVKANSGGVWSIEGNTDGDGGREGIEVARRFRPRSSKMHFVNVGD